MRKSAGMEDMGQPNGPKVSFTRMADGTPEDYELLARFEDEFAAGTADRVLAHLRELPGSLAGNRKCSPPRSWRICTPHCKRFKPSPGSLSRNWCPGG